MQLLAYDEFKETERSNISRRIVLLSFWMETFGTPNPVHMSNQNNKMTKEKNSGLCHFDYCLLNMFSPNQFVINTYME